MSVVVISVLINLIFICFKEFFLKRYKIKVKNCNGREHSFIAMTDGSVCADCYSNEEVTIGVGERKTIPLGFCLELPDFMEAVIRPRSGMTKKGIDVQYGTIDTDYRGEVSCTVVNNSKEDYVVTEGLRICQIGFRTVPALEIEEVDSLSKTERGSNGFGSTGEY